MRESPIYRGKKSLRAYPIAFLGAVLFAIGGLLSFPEGAAAFPIAIALVVAPYLACMATDYSITSEGIHQRSGLISRNTSEAELGDVRNVQVRQGILQRLLGIGDVLISTAGQSDFEFAFAGVVDPHGVAETLRRARKKRTEPRKPPAVQPDTEREPSVYEIK